MLEIGFLGDTSFSGIFSETSIERNFHDCYKLRSQLLNNHYNVVNLEGPLTNKPISKKVGIGLRSLPSNLNTLTDLNVKVFNLANNHIMDSGPEGLNDTLSYLSNANLSYFGAGMNLDEASRYISLEKNGIKVAIIGVCHNEGIIAQENSPGIFGEKHISLIRTKIKEAQKSHDWVIVNYHGGEEFTYFPMPRRRKQLRTYLNWGADIIIAHHSHVVQGYEVLDEKTVFYSLGNFIFDIEPHYSHEGTDESVIINLRFTKTSYSFVPLFTCIERNSRKITEQVENHRFTPIDSYYKRNWLADCYRVFFPKPPSNDLNNQDQSTDINSRSLVDYIISPRSYVSVAKIMRARNTRPIFIGAIAWIILSRLNAFVKRQEN